MLEENAVRPCGLTGICHQCSATKRTGQYQPALQNPGAPVYSQGEKWEIPYFISPGNCVFSSRRDGPDGIPHPTARSGGVAQETAPRHGPAPPDARRTESPAIARAITGGKLGSDPDKLGPQEKGPDLYFTARKFPPRFTLGSGRTVFDCRDRHHPVRESLPAGDPQQWACHICARSFKWRRPAPRPLQRSRGMLGSLPVITPSLTNADDAQPQLPGGFWFRS